ncbi:hypothetical protein H6P81_006884 [Aristolochia fimbriata]|uniref:Uncharacterized protein n=1 Tax=Aristolochia fimbriata TaxID=158543 RepID=A0AAV7EYI3_ARIFI|nr:hypothetical protein H6P81_006884 [Aristolochia fimbriata]
MIQGKRPFKSYHLHKLSRTENLGGFGLSGLHSFLPLSAFDFRCLRKRKLRSFPVSLRLESRNRAGRCSSSFVEAFPLLTSDTSYFEPRGIDPGLEPISKPELGSNCSARLDSAGLVDVISSLNGGYASRKVGNRIGSHLVQQLVVIVPEYF